MGDVVVSDNGVLLSIDPGIRGTGSALFRDGKLIAAAYVKNPAKSGSGPRECATVAAQVFLWNHNLWLKKLGPIGPALYAVDQLAMEFPTTYGGRASTGNTNALFPLAAIDGALAALLPKAELTYYLPREWKSNMDPDAMIERIKSRLSPEELTCVELPAKSLQHNVWDGIGVGLHFLGRLTPKKIFARE